MYRIMAFLPFGVIIRSRRPYTRAEANAEISTFPPGFQIIEERVALRYANAIEFPLVEENNARSGQERHS